MTIKGLQDEFETGQEHNKQKGLNAGAFKDGGHFFLVPFVPEGTTPTNIKIPSIRVTGGTPEIYVGGGTWVPVSGSGGDGNFTTLTVTGTSNLNGQTTVGTATTSANLGVFGDIGATGDIVSGGNTAVGGTFQVGDPSNYYNALIYGFLGTYNTAFLFEGFQAGDSADPKNNSIYGNLFISDRIFNTPPSASGTPVVVSGGIFYQDVSSIRYKYDIEKLPVEESKKLLNVSAWSYKLKESDQYQHGILAEKVAEQFPHMATRDKDGKIEGYKKLELIPHLLNLVKDLNERVSELERRLSE